MQCTAVVDLAALWVCSLGCFCSHVTSFAHIKSHNISASMRMSTFVRYVKLWICQCDHLRYKQHPRTDVISNSLSCDSEPYKKLHVWKSQHIGLSAVSTLCLTSVVALSVSITANNSLLHSATLTKCDSELEFSTTLHETETPLKSMTYTKDAANKSFLLGPLNERWDLTFCFLGPCAKEMSVFCTSIFYLPTPLEAEVVCLQSLTSFSLSRHWENEAEYFVPHYTLCSVLPGRPQTSILDLSNRNTIQSFWLAWDIIHCWVSRLIHTWTVCTDQCTFCINPFVITGMCFIHTCSDVWLLTYICLLWAGLLTTCV
jgi:hypothetical protein